MGITPEKLQKQSKLRRCPVQFAGRWEESIASNKERNRVVVRLDFDVNSAAASAGGGTPQRNRVASRLDFDVKGAAASGYRA